MKAHDLGDEFVSFIISCKSGKDANVSEVLTLFTQVSNPTQPLLEHVLASILNSEDWTPVFDLVAKKVCG
jgi:hypothetical protein